jgi:CRP-like cAMP-binding protein
MTPTHRVTMQPSQLLARRFSALLREAVSAAELEPLLDVRSHRPGDSLDGALGAGAPGTRFVLAGWVSESVILPDGRRQIIAFALPGDRVAPPEKGMEGAFLTAGRTGVLPSTGAGNPTDAALGAEEQMRLRQLVVRLGRCSAYERTAHLLLDLHERLLRVGLADATAFHLPLTQEVLADALGLSIVHVNRTLQQLRREGRLVLRGSQATLPDREGLACAVHYALTVETPPAALGPGRVA